MTDSEKVTAYIEKHTQWTSELSQLREIFANTKLKEEIKWGSPTYTLGKKLVAGIAAFKNHYAIWFHQGVFLIDTPGKLVNAKDGVTRALRQWRFEKNDLIETELILAYVEEAIQNSIDGKEIKPQRKKGVTILPFLKNALNKNSELNTAFEKLTPGKQREYAEHIGDAKREETNISRLKKCTPMILEGKGLHDKYKNC
jgi:uncharacterized protein YdeI (YjbR/CyaY-like superfamily)